MEQFHQSYEEKNAVLKVLDTGTLSGFQTSPNGKCFGEEKMSKKLETSFKNKFNVKYAVAVNSALFSCCSMISSWT